MAFFDLRSYPLVLQNKDKLLLKLFDLLRIWGQEAIAAVLLLKTIFVYGGLYLS